MKTDSASPQEDYIRISSISIQFLSPHVLLRSIDDDDLPDTDLVSKEVSPILAQRIEIRVPGQELRDSNRWVREGHGSTSV